MPRSAPTPTPTPTTALVRASAASADDSPLLAEALRLAEQTRNTVEDALVAYGRWLLVHVFDNDASAALSQRSENPLWLELLRRAGGPTLQLSRRFLNVAIAIAAHDKRITDDAWRLLEPGRKELLLPLGEEKAMRKAAAHVVKLKLSQRSTRIYVNTLRREQGAPAKSRLTGDRARVDLGRFLGLATGTQYEQRLFATVKKLSTDERKKVAKQATDLRAFAMRLARAAREGLPPLNEARSAAVMANDVRSRRAARKSRLLGKAALSDLRCGGGCDGQFRATGPHRSTRSGGDRGGACRSIGNGSPAYPRLPTCALSECGRPVLLC